MDITITTTRQDVGQSPVVITEIVHKDAKGGVAVDTGVTTRQDSGGAQTTSDTIVWEQQIVG